MQSAHAPLIVGQQVSIDGSRDGSVLQADRVAEPLGRRNVSDDRAEHGESAVRVHDLQGRCSTDRHGAAGQDAQAASRHVGRAGEARSLAGKEQCDETVERHSAG